MTAALGGHVKTFALPSALPTEDTQSPHVQAGVAALTPASSKMGLSHHHLPCLRQGSSRRQWRLKGHWERVEQSQGAARRGAALLASF